MPHTSMVHVHIQKRSLACTFVSKVIDMTSANAEDVELGTLERFGFGLGGAGARD